MSSWSVSFKTCVLLTLLISVVEANTDKKSLKSESLNSSSSYYYLDNGSQCNTYSGTQFFYSFSTTAYVNAWTSTYDRYPLGSSCYITFGSYQSYGMKYRFASSSNYIGSDSGVRLNIYASSSNYGRRMASYTSSSYLPTSYIHTSTGYITIELENYQTSSYYDFGLVVKNYDGSDYMSTTGEIVGLVVGACVLVIIICVVILVVRRRRRLRILRGDVLIAPAGPAAYPQPSYGSVTTTTTSNYPPPPSYPGPPPAGSTGYPGPPPAGSTGYPQPPPPAGSTGYPQPPPPAGSTGYPQPPPPAGFTGYPQPPPPAGFTGYPQPPPAK